MSDTRIVLIKPGDILIIGNLGEHTPEDYDHLTNGLRELKESLRLAGVVLFEGDIDLAAVTPSVVADCVAAAPVVTDGHLPGGVG